MEATAKRTSLKVCVIGPLRDQENPHWDFYFRVTVATDFLSTPKWGPYRFLELADADRLAAKIAHDRNLPIHSRINLPVPKEFKPLQPEYEFDADPEAVSEHAYYQTEDIPY